MKLVFAVFLFCFLGCSHENPLTEHEHDEVPHEHLLAEHKHPIETHEHQHGHKLIEHVHELTSHEHQPTFVEHEHDESPHEHLLAEHKHPIETHEHQHGHKLIEHVHELTSHEHQPTFVEHEHDEAPHEHPLTEHEHDEKPHEHVLSEHLHELAEHKHPTLAHGHDEIVEQLRIEMLGLDDPQLVATQATTAPADGSVITKDSSITLTLDEAVESVSVEGVPATGYGKTWTLNVKGMNLDFGEQILAIEWINKDGSTGSDSVTLIVEHGREITQPDIEVDEYLERMYGELSGRYSLVTVIYVKDDEAALTLKPPAISGSLTIDGDKMITMIGVGSYVSYYTLSEDNEMISYLDRDHEIVEYVGVLQWDGESLFIGVPAEDWDLIAFNWLRL